MLAGPRASAICMISWETISCGPRRVARRSRVHSTRSEDEALGLLWPTKGGNDEPRIVYKVGEGCESGCEDPEALPESLEVTTYHEGEAFGSKSAENAYAPPHPNGRSSAYRLPPSAMLSLPHYTLNRGHCRTRGCPRVPLRPPLTPPPFRKRLSIFLPVSQKSENRRPEI